MRFGVVDIIEMPIEPEDEFFVVACDGVWDVMSNEDVLSFTKERIGKMPLETIAELIMDNCICADPKVCAPSSF